MDPPPPPPPPTDAGIAQDAPAEGAKPANSSTESVMQAATQQPPTTKFGPLQNSGPSSSTHGFSSSTSSQWSGPNSTQYAASTAFLVRTGETSSAIQSPTISIGSGSQIRMPPSSSSHITQGTPAAAQVAIDQAGSLISKHSSNDTAARTKTPPTLSSSPSVSAAASITSFVASKKGFDSGKLPSIGSTSASHAVGTAPSPTAFASSVDRLPLGHNPSAGVHVKGGPPARAGDPSPQMGAQSPLSGSSAFASSGSGKRSPYPSTLPIANPGLPPSHHGSTLPAPTVTKANPQSVTVASANQAPLSGEQTATNARGKVPKGRASGTEPSRPAPPQQPAPVGPGGGMRELRVEDALLYLDEVKREFKHRPAIYNEFLSIMKNFKTQEVDTPGVINRVSRLFRGYHNLILGFNTFLPEGFKISMEDLRRQEEQISREQKLISMGVAPHIAAQMAAGQLSRTPPTAAAATSVAAPPQPQVPVPKRQTSPPPSGMWLSQPSTEEGPPTAVARAPTPPQTQPQPPTAVPSKPPSHAKIQPKVPSAVAPLPSRVQPPQQPPPPQLPPAHVVAAVPPKPPIRPQPATSGPPPAAPPAQGQPVQQHQAVEFDHAISYVTKIKRRFASDPSIYHSFLEILHNYQREQRGIKEVLEQVALLFQDHPDLLKEFTFFLPDAVQEQAKERLHRAAAESESRQAAQRQQEIQQQQSVARKAPAPPVSAPTVAAAPASPQHPKLIDMTRANQMPLQEEDARATRKRLFEGQQKKQTQVTQPLPDTLAQQVPIVGITMDQPETHIYNAAVERQFFDATKEALTSYTRDGGQAWAEFLKCLDMYAQEILSRNEMLNFVEPLLGKRNSKLFEEFKRILSAAGNPSGATPPTEESWYSVPLSEIDFSRCRRCSPSYRALPRDYPAHPCSGRSPEESKVLNDVWVSLPVGSEESYTFRHMRRNTYEETLFRVEDERFEIDMVIDSNAATLQRLLPIAEEIALLSKEDVVPLDFGSGKTALEAAGLGGKRFQYSFDKKILGVIHRNTIARIYGDSGQEMLDLMVKNPTVTVPLVVDRLRQKDQEWRAVRERLNRHWKELAEQNYYKSLDHRGLTWRTIDKRATSTRTMIAEIKDRAANGGIEGSEALKQKLEKAKEEHGAFYEITMGNALSKNVDLTFLPKPDRRIFTPHLSLLYTNNSWAQRDAYRILTYALERGTITPADKERCHRLWIEFLGPWFDLSLNWMQRPAIHYQETTAAAMRTIPAAEATVVSEDDEEESMDEEAEIAGHVVTEEVLQSDAAPFKGKPPRDCHAFSVDTPVLTVFGEGKVICFRKSDNTYIIRLNTGAMAYIRPASVLCTLLPVEKSAYTRELRANDRTKLARLGDHLAFGTQSLYLFFRLHQILIQRLNTAKKLAYTVDDDHSLTTLIEQLPNENRNVQGRARYEAYLSLVYALLDGGVSGAAEGGKYEDRVRSLLGHGGYELATMDKLISHIWKNLQALAGDETMWNLIQLYRRHLEAGSFQPEAFRQEAAYLSDGEVMYAFQHCPINCRDESVLYVEYVGIMDEEDEPMEEAEVVEPSGKRHKR